MHIARKFILSCMVGCLLPCSFMAQIHLIPNNLQEIKVDQYQSPILAGVLNVIMKDNLDANALQLGLTKLQNSIPLFQLLKRFPQAEKPRQTYNKSGFRLADLSTHYRILFDPSFNIQQAISTCSKSGLFSEIEPHFIPELCYVPNDDSVSNQYALERIKAFDAWAIEKGDSNMVIGISDTGCDFLHPDLISNIAYNYNDPINGIDDDGDGYVDNFYGWDLGENDNLPQSTTSSHGVHVTGLSSAKTDNQIGMAGSGFNCRFVPLKITNASGSLIAAYESIVYAADRGFQFINCSWGSYQSSVINFEIVRYATINKGALIFCGAGNNDSERQFFPASYDFTVSMGSTGPADLKSDFSNYGYRMDLYAPGENVLSSWPGNAYIYSNGTSMASPVAAGCAAIVKSKFPSLNGLQVGQLLKLTADKLDTINGNEVYTSKLGYGRVNMFRAITEENKKSILMHELSLSDGKGNLFLPSDTLQLVGTFTNLLNDVSISSVNFSVIKGDATLLNSNFSLGSMSSLSFLNNAQNPLQIIIGEQAPINDTVVLKIQIWADGHVSTQYFQFNSNADFVKLNNNISTTLNSIAELGKVNNNLINNRGFRYKSSGNLLFEGNFMLGISPEQVFNVARSESGQSSRDFKLIQKIKQLPSIELDEFEGYFDNQLNPVFSGFQIRQKAYVPQSAGERDFIVLTYEIENQGNSPMLKNVYAGLFHDWDIPEFFNNQIMVLPEHKMAVIFNPFADTLLVGVKLLSDQNFYSYALDLNPNDSNPLINMQDGFTSHEKYYALSHNNWSVNESNIPSDVALTVSSGPFFIPNGAKKVLSFAILCSSSLDSLIYLSDQVQQFYNQTLIPLSAIDLKQNQFKIFPNPTTNQQVNLIFPMVDDYEIKFFDATGRLVKKYQTVNSDQSNINVELPKGVYFIQITGLKNRLSHQGKLLIAE